VVGNEYNVELEKCAVVSTCRPTSGECKFSLHLLPLDKNVEQVEKCAVTSTCTLTLLRIPTHPHCKV